MHQTDHLYRRSSERLRYAVDVARKTINDAYKIFSVGKKPYHQLFSDVCQDITAQLDTLNILIKPLLDAAPKYDFEDVEANGLRSLLSVVDCALKEMIVHLKYCIDKHKTFFFNGINAANKLSSFCSLLSKLGKLLDVATLMDQQLCGEGMFLELNNPVGNICMQEVEALSRECFYGQLVAFQYTPSIQNLMKGICVALTSYGLGFYSDVPPALGQPTRPKSIFWKSSASIIGGARYWFKDSERSRKFVELTHKCASIGFTKSFWNLVESGILAEVPRLMTSKCDVAIDIFINGEPLYVRNQSNQMILIHPPVGKDSFVGVTVGFFSSVLREGQYSPPPNDPSDPPPLRHAKCSRLLIHFHGGGFVSGSHTYHESYLRNWCKELDAVIVSINYSLAPENPFPKGLDDCLFAYAWCLENLHNLGCTGKSIVFMGDSAGGNLAISTAMRANSYGLRCPDAILAAYPCTYVKYAGSLSRLLSVMDILLPTGVLQCCVRAYAGVPVDNNIAFHEWLQTAETQSADGTDDKEQKKHPSISELNSRYISDIAKQTSIDGDRPESRYDLPDTPEMPTFTPTEKEELEVFDDGSENNPEHYGANETMTVDKNATEIEIRTDITETEEQSDPPPIDTIMINPIVFDELPQKAPRLEHQTTPENTPTEDKANPEDVPNYAVKTYNLHKEVGENNELNKNDEVEESDENYDGIDENQKEPEAPNMDVKADVNEKVKEITEVEENIENDKLHGNEQIQVIDEKSIVEKTELDNGIIKEADVIEKVEIEHDGIKDAEVMSDVVKDIEVTESTELAKPTELTEPTEFAEPTELAEPAELTEPTEIAEPTELTEPTELAEKTDVGDDAAADNDIVNKSEANETKLKYDLKAEEIAGKTKEQKQNGDKLEQMLYDDVTTHFKASKLVLTPEKGGSNGKAGGGDGDGGGGNSSVSTRPVESLGMAATVIQDTSQDLTEQSKEPIYVINPGEIATRTNITLLQKYFDDPFLSPVLATEEMLSQLPPVHIVAAELDPLLDDSVAFCRKLKSSGGKVSFEVVPGMTHGFLNLVISSSQCANAAKRCMEILLQQYTATEETRS